MQAGIVADMARPPTSTPPAVVRVAAPGAPAGARDATRRWVLAFPDGRRRFAGVNPVEGDRAATVLNGLVEVLWDRALVEIALPVVLSDGAGPYLLDADGRITLALGAHPARPDDRVAMGEAAPDHRIGLVQPAGGGVWRWVVDAVVAPADRALALGDLDAASTDADVDRWGRTYGTREAR